jgi:hypothetical protein
MGTNNFYYCHYYYYYNYNYYYYYYYFAVIPDRSSSPAICTQWQKQH